MRISLSTAIFSIFVLGFFGIFALPRWFYARQSQPIWQARTKIRWATTRIRDFQAQTGAPPVSVASSTAAGSFAPTSIQWDDMLDPTSPGGKQPIRYWTGGGKSWIVSAMGPDHVHDLRPEPWMFESKAESDQRWQLLQYDPTNGTVSNGDIIVASWQGEPKKTVYNPPANRKPRRGDR